MSVVAPPDGVDAALFGRLVAVARGRARDVEPAHDFSHVLRVVENARVVARAEGAEEGVVVTAALLHELVAIPKGHPDAAKAGDLAADAAKRALEEKGASPSLVEPVALAIRDHAFSKGVVPDALEARVLQDADRLDALGAIGLARMWATTADMKRPFYSPEDPFCTRRAPDDKAWGLDHVYKKLLVVPERLHTRTARALARPRVAFLYAYLDALRAELSPIEVPQAIGE